jgi:hypothetical protein
MANPLDFLQLTPENIAQAKGMGWGQALKTDLASGYNPRYTGKGATGLGGYIKSGFQSLAGNVPASGGVGGATPLTRKLALSAMDYAPKALGIASKFLGPASFLFNATPANADEINMTAEDFQNLALQNQTQPIDPTGKNLFTQYYEDDPYAGIEGQTAFLGLPQLFGLLTKGGISKQAIKKAIIKDQVLGQIGKKTKPFITRKIREKLGEKFGGTGKFKNIATGTKDYGPHTKPKSKPKIVAKHSPHGGGGGGSKGTHSTQGGGGQKGSMPTGTAGKNPWGRADGGLINFYRYGGFIG